MTDISQERFLWSLTNINWSLTNINKSNILNYLRHLYSNSENCKPIDTKLAIIKFKSAQDRYNL